MIEQTTAGLDWITLTLGTGALLDQEFLEKGLRCLDEVVKEGYLLEYRRLLGYEGVGAGGCFIGSREDGHIIQFSGRFADMFFWRVYRYDCHISRIDIQVTCKFHTMPKRVAKEAYRDAITENASLSVGRRRKIWIVVGSDGGDTCYVGSASSDARARIYNKEVQSEDILYSKCWRYEVVLKNEQAQHFASYLTKRRDTATQYCSDWVAVWFEKRGVQAPWVHDAANVAIPPLKTLPTDIERKLNWLKHQVRPTVEYLLTVQDKETILQLLGLS